MKQINQQRVLQMIHSEGPLSRVEISQKLGLTQQTITNIMGRLLADDIVVEDEPVSSPGGGRKPVPLRINTRGLHAIGIEIAVKHISGFLVDFERNVLSQEEVTIQEFRDEHHTLECVTHVIDQLLMSLSNHSTIQGMGISIQGLVDVNEGIVLKAKELKWNHYPLRKLLEDKYPFQVYLENDVNMVAVSENLSGMLSESSDNIIIKIDRGVGGAIVVGKNLFTGHNHVAGEFGHYKVAYGDAALPCHCGGQGCLTTIASIGALEQQSGLNFVEMKERLQRGDEYLQQIILESADIIANMASNLVTVFNPNCVLFLGIWFELAGESVFQEIERKVRETSLSHSNQVKLMVLKDKLEGAQLASSVVIKQFFMIPTMN
ncbi:ROK family transcriptional regulator [Paenibacillus sp. yr247]|uniref:ROK family transcriptional regulator n=1 Tax=Paenibacillus sp. yr247 TaxID=1761880 RepID=UPI0015872051|nr:ROK family transcriptional regulator [Paenibacillus sp. yr247]